MAAGWLSAFRLKWACSFLARELGVEGVISCALFSSAILDSVADQCGEIFVIVILVQSLNFGGFFMANVYPWF